MKIAFVIVAAVAAMISFSSTAGTILLTKKGGALDTPTVATLLIEFHATTGVKDEAAKQRFEAALFDSYGEPGQFTGGEDLPQCARTKAAANGYGTWVHRVVTKAKVPVRVTKVTYNCLKASEVK